MRTMMSRIERNNIPMSNDVYQWPEFIAFARRLGLTVDPRTRAIDLSMRHGDPVVVNTEYLGSDKIQELRNE